MGVSFGAVIALTLMVAIATYSGVGNLRSQMHDISSKHLAAEQAMVEFTFATGRARTLEFRIAGTVGEKGRALEQDYASYVEKSNKSLSDLEKLASTPNETEKLAKVKSSWEKAVANWKSIEKEVVDMAPAAAFNRVESVTSDQFLHDFLPATEEATKAFTKAGNDVAAQSD